MASRLQAILRPDAHLAVRTVTLVAAMVGTGLATGAALFGHSSLGSTIGPVIGVFLVFGWREREYLTLSPTQRRSCRRVLQTGAPSGEPEVDDVALLHLQRLASTSPRAERAALAVLIPAFTVLLVVATLREHTRWYLLDLTIVGWLAVQYWRRRRQPSASQRLQTLTDALPW